MCCRCVLSCLLFPVGLRSGAVMAKAIVQLTKAERAQIDNIVRTKKMPATEALRQINAARKRSKVREVEKSTVYRYVRGLTHKPRAPEKRGRKRSLSMKDVRSLDQARRRLIKRARNEERVTYEDVVKEAGLSKKACQRVCADALRAGGVAYRPPRRKIYISEDDAKIRKEMAKKWLKLPKGFWQPGKGKAGVHAYHDEKAFPCPLTPAQRKRYKQAQVTGHLRKPSEGIDRGFTKPREKQSFVGIPSVTVSAVVSKDKVIMWHVVEKKWNGESAADMYEKHLRPAMQRVWGKRARYTVVEDGDRKGNMSGKGVAAKARAKIVAMTLPPRTPSLMPLDYAIWHKIEQSVTKGAPKGTETKAAFLARLRRAAMSLPKGYVKSVIGRMRGNIQALAAAGGHVPKND